MGLIWLKKPVLWHSERVLGPSTKKGLTDAQRLMVVKPFLSWYTADWDYGQTSVEFLCAAVAVAALLNVAYRLRARKRRGAAPTAPAGFADRTAGWLRYFVARQFYVKTRLFEWYSPPLSAIVAVAACFLFFMALMLGKSPYYWPNMLMGHSPPIATRTGWISIAIMPFMIALASKVNYIALLTGTSHEKLQVFHRWTAVIMYITSLVHTFPFIVQSIAEHDMVNQWKTSTWYWTGVAALVPQTYLMFLSWGFFRNKYYETFKKLHFIAAGIFMVALFVHVGFRLTSWDYFLGTLVVYGSTWLFRFLRTLYNGLALTASISASTAAPDGLVAIHIPVPARVKWTPGQHVFVRFWGLGVHAFSSHPFTVASLDSANGDRKIELVLRAHSGITRALAQRVQGRVAATCKVWVDGPYGGVPGGLAGYDKVLLLAGGSGATFCVPLLADLAARKATAAQKIEFIVALRDRSDYEWMASSVAQAEGALSAEQLSVRIHITGEDRATKQQAGSSSSLSGLDDKIDESDVHSRFVDGRPDLPALIHKACVDTPGRIAIAVCGPDSFLYDVRNAVAVHQLAIADGYGVCKEIFLHTETYSW